VSLAHTNIQVVACTVTSPHALPTLTDNQPTIDKAPYIDKLSLISTLNLYRFINKTLPIESAYQ
jgi:hypothetical protein